MVEKQLEVTVKILNAEFKANYVIENWCTNPKEIVEVFGPMEEFLDDSQMLKSYHTTHGAFRRRCYAECVKAARIESPAVMEKVETIGEDGQPAWKEQETAASVEALHRKMIELAPTVIAKLNGTKLQFTRGGRGPTQNDYVLAEKALADFTANPQSYEEIRRLAKDRYDLKLPANPTVDTLANYLRTKALAKRAKVEESAIHAFLE